MTAGFLVCLAFTKKTRMPGAALRIFFSEANRKNGKQTIRSSFGLLHDTGALYYPERWTTNPRYLHDPIGISIISGNLAISRLVKSAIWVKRQRIFGGHTIAIDNLHPGSSATTNQRTLLYLANPLKGQYYGAILQSDDGANSHYEGVLLSLRHRRNLPDKDISLFNRLESTSREIPKRLSCGLQR